MPPLVAEGTVYLATDAQNHLVVPSLYAPGPSLFYIPRSISYLTWRPSLMQVTAFTAFAGVYTPGIVGIEFVVKVDSFVASGASPYIQLQLLGLHPAGAHPAVTLATTGTLINAASDTPWRYPVHPIGAAGVQDALWPYWTINITHTNVASAQYSVVTGLLH